MRLNHMPALKRKKAISFVWSLLAFSSSSGLMIPGWSLPKINIWFALWFFSSGCRRLKDSFSDASFAASILCHLVFRQVFFFIRKVKHHSLIPSPQNHFKSRKSNYCLILCCLVLVWFVKDIKIAEEEEEAWRVLQQLRGYGWGVIVVMVIGNVCDCRK